MKKDHWIIIVFLLTFVLSVLFSTVSNVIALSCNNIVLFIVLVLTISFGILFDLIGTAAITGNESTFHALNSKKIKGAKQGLAIVKNSNNISSFCNDIVGDICGIISGAAGVTIVALLVNKTNINPLIISLIVTSLISSLTIGGKALGKNLAINKSTEVVTFVAKVLSIFTKK